MPSNYNRCFVTLKTESSNYGYKSKEPFGRCIIESSGDKGKLSLLVQDLKPEITYKTCLLFPDNDNVLGVTAGLLFVDAKGKGEYKCEFSAKNVFNANVDIDKLSGVVILVMNKNELTAALVGYVNTPFQWKNKYIDFSAKAKEPQKQTETEQNTTDVLIPETKLHEPEIGAIAEDLIAELDTPEPLPELEQFDSNLSGIDATNFRAIEYEDDEDTTIDAEAQKDPLFTTQIEAEQVQPEPTEIMQTQLEQVDSEELQPEQLNVDSQAHEDKASENPALSYLDYIFEHHIQMTPFKTMKLNIKWVRITQKEPINLSLDYQKLFRHPFITLSYKKYNHLILGEHDSPPSSRKSYFLGVPDIYRYENKLIAMSLGFTQFKCCEDIKPKNGEYGYWIMQVY